MKLFPFEALSKAIWNSRNLPNQKKCGNEQGYLKNREVAPSMTLGGDVILGNG